MLTFDLEQTIHRQPGIILHIPTRVQLTQINSAEARGGSFENILARSMCIGEKSAPGQERVGARSRVLKPELPFAGSEL